MMDALLSNADSARDTMRRYRAAAEECRANAAKTKDLILTARPGLMQFAQLCEILADSIEARLGEDRHG